MSLTTDIDGLQALWSRTLGDPRVLIALLDGPIDLSHPTLAGARLRYLDEQPAPTDRSLFGHGTHIASLIFGQHSGSVKGIAPSGSGLVIPIFDNASFVCSPSNARPRNQSGSDGGRAYHQCQCRAVFRIG